MKNDNNNSAFSSGVDSVLNNDTGNTKAITTRRVVPLPAKPGEVARKPEAYDVVQQESKMHCTTDYDKFKLLASNREIDFAHVRKLAAKITQKNLLHINPMVVNGKYEIIEGQHRREAAKLLGVPIYYIIDDTVTDDDIATLNTNRKAWNMMNYVDFYTSKGYPAYKTFSTFCNQNPEFSPSILVNLCSPTGTRDTADVHSGKLDVSNIETGRVLIGYLKDFAKHENIKPIAFSARFIEAIIFMNATGNYDHARMMGRVAVQPTKLVPCANRKQYVQLLNEIYNYGMRQESLVHFFIR